jgi:hypothetical protein
MALPAQSDVIWVAGPCDVFVGIEGAVASAMLYLGHTRNGAEIELREYEGEVPTDENGGEEGPPTDKQFFGMSATIRLDMTRYLDTAMAQVRFAMASGSVVGTLATAAGTLGAGYLPSEVGKLKYANANMYRLLVRATFGQSHVLTTPEQAKIWNFPRCSFQEPKSVNHGSKFSAHLLLAAAYPKLLTPTSGNPTNVLYNQDDT